MIYLLSNFNFSIKDMEVKGRDVLKILDELQIRYKQLHHPPVDTVSEAETYWKDLPGGHCKNLFLRNAKGKQHYLLVVSFTKTVDLKRFGADHGLTRLSFASSERLSKNLALTPGSVSPFGLINDKINHVKVYIDNALLSYDLLNFHPNINTSTLTISQKDFIRFLEWTQNEILFTDL